MRSEAVLVACLAVAGCAGGSTGELGADARSDSMDDVAATVEVKLQDEGVRFLLHVTNTSDGTLDFTFRSSQRYDFVVRDASGAEVWRWSDDRAFLQAISEITMAPGETWEFEAEWAPGGRSGLHEVVAEVTAEEHEIRQSASFELP